MLKIHFIENKRFVYYYFFISFYYCIKNIDNKVNLDTKMNEKNCFYFYILKIFMLNVVSREVLL